MMTTAAPTFADNFGDLPPEAQLALALRIASCLQNYKSELKAIAVSLNGMMKMAGSLHGVEVINMLKNKLGLSREEAKKVYFQFRNKGNKSNPEEPAKPEPQGTEEKIAVIMDYMKDTSEKLERIESDIDYLKQQIDRILKQL